MRIAFICSSLEQGKDGVGDYTLKLASELVFQGHQVICVSVHDKHLIQSQYSFETLLFPNGEIPTHRFSCQYAWRRKANRIHSFLKSFQPNWISFQFVGYGFSTYGLPFGLAWLLKLRSLANWHIMIHETWILVTPRPKDKILSVAQAFFLKAFLCSFRPKLITTSNSVYQRMIASLGFRSEILKVFSIIDFNPRCEAIVNFQSDEWSFLLFGSLPKGWNLKSFFEKIDVARRHHGIKSCRFIIVGRIVVDPVELLQSFESLGYSSFIFQFLGELNAKEISCLMQRVDFGISKTPQSMIDKSTVVAAMRLHNIPILVAVEELKTPYVSRLPPAITDVILFDDNYCEALVDPPRAADPSNFMSVVIARKFSTLLLDT